MTNTFQRIFIDNDCTYIGRCDCTGHCVKNNFVGWIAPSNPGAYIIEFQKKVNPIRAACQQVVLTDSSAFSCASRFDPFWLDYSCKKALLNYTSSQLDRYGTAGSCMTFSKLQALNFQCASVLGGIFSQYNNGSVYFSSSAAPPNPIPPFVSVAPISPSNCVDNICITNSYQTCYSGGAYRLNCASNLVTVRSSATNGCMCQLPLPNSRLGGSCTNSTGNRDDSVCPINSGCFPTNSSAWMCGLGRAVGG